MNKAIEISLSDTFIGETIIFRDKGFENERAYLLERTGTDKEGKIPVKFYAWQQGHHEAMPKQPLNWLIDGRYKVEVERQA